ncbi:MAG: DoxX family membrane protein [Patescibacteria group bacterium]|nr:DoxX family membrane protein [Patescibacteria group bacterium]
MEGTKRVVFSWNVLRYAYGAVLLLAGLDKLLGTDFIVFWPKYISPLVASYLPVSTGVFLGAMGVVEIVVAIMLVTKWPRIGGYLSVVWLVLIAINLLMLGYIDIAIRDLLLAVGALALAELTVAVEQLKLVKESM